MMTLNSNQKPSFNLSQHLLHTRSKSLDYYKQENVHVTSFIDKDQKPISYHDPLQVRSNNIFQAKITKKAITTQHSSQNI